MKQHLILCSVLSNTLTKRHRELLPKKECECGCHELIPIITADYKEARFKSGHNRRGQHTNNHPIYKTKELVKCACGCQEMIWNYDSQWRPRFYKNNHDKKGFRGRIYGKKHHKFNEEGRGMTENGYVKIKCPWHSRADMNGWILEHIVIMEQYLGRYLVEPEEVHHKNGHHDDNRIENLELMSDRSTHLSFHNKFRKRNKKGQFEKGKYNELIK